MFAAVNLYTRRIHFPLSAFYFHEDPTIFTVVFVVPPTPPSDPVNTSFGCPRLVYHNPVVGIAQLVPSTLWPTLKRPPKR